jgi:hypothetical protein
MTDRLPITLHATFGPGPNGCYGSIDKGAESVPLDARNLTALFLDIACGLDPETAIEIFFRIGCNRKGEKP